MTSRLSLWSHPAIAGRWRDLLLLQRVAGDDAPGTGVFAPRDGGLSFTA